MPGTGALDLPPAFTRSVTSGATVWTFAETAAGPFGSVFGGIVAAALIEQARTVAPAHGLLASIAVNFLRPTGLGESVVEAELVHAGRRIALVDAVLLQDGKPTARGRVTLVTPLSVDGLPVSSWAALRPGNPEALPAPPLPRPRLTKVWSGDLLESRIDEPGGVRWLRRLDEARLPLSPSAFAVAMSDYAAGYSRPDSWQQPVVKGFPNPNLFVSLVREPRGAWVGLRPRSVWDASGLGAAQADLIDRDGAFGVAALTSLLIPFAPEELGERRNAWK